MPEMTKGNCVGCEDDFYNNYDISGVKECRSFISAKLILRKKIANHQRPPWKQSAHLFPSCYRQRGYVLVNGNREY